MQIKNVSGYFRSDSRISTNWVTEMMSLCENANTGGDGNALSRIRKAVFHINFNPLTMKEFLEDSVLIQYDLPRYYRAD